MISTGESIINIIQNYGLEDAKLHSVYITDAGNVRLLFEVPRTNYGCMSRRSAEEEEEARHIGTLRWVELEPIMRSLTRSS